MSLPSPYLHDVIYKCFLSQVPNMSLITKWFLYGSGIKAPGILDYVVAHNLIRAHAKAYRLYQREFAVSQEGKKKSGRIKALLLLHKNDYCGPCFGATSAAPSAGYCGGRNRKIKKAQ